MARGLSRGQIWMYAYRPPDKRRPVVVLSRADALMNLHTVIVAPITSTVRGLPSEVPVGVAEGLKHHCVVNLDHVNTVEQSRLEHFVGTLEADKLRQLCRALAVATGCDDGRH